jgi:hypothetical protein
MFIDKNDKNILYGRFAGYAFSKKIEILSKPNLECLYFFAY